VLLLRRAHFANFRLLRDVELSFSTDFAKPLTVIRAANDSGKTTILTALQWAFFGDGVLPQLPGRPYRLHPIDWDATAAPRVPISVEVEFEVTSETVLREGATVEEREDFLLRRSCTEQLSEDGTSGRGPSTLVLYRLLPAGDEPVANPNLVLEDKLPSKLREVFFTDGDRALAFIEAGTTQGSKRTRVQHAIRALLGLDLIEDAQKHAKATLAEMNRAVKTMSPNTEAGKLGERLAEIESELSEAEDAKRNAKEALSRLELQIRELDTHIAEALRQGNRDQLEAQLRSAEEELKAAERTERELIRRHSDLFKDTFLVVDLMAPQLRKAKDLLVGLRERGTIPKKFLPVLEEALEHGTCVCGTSLAENTPARTHVCDLIEEHRRADDIADRLTDLNTLAAAKYVSLLETDAESWAARARSSFQLVSDARRALDLARERAKELDEQLKALPDTAIADLVKLKTEAEEQKRVQTRAERDAEIKISSLGREKTELTAKQDKLLRAEQKYNRLRANLQATNDVHRILNATYTAIQHGKMREVSEQMNRFFLEMIVADTAQHAIIQKAEITPDYDIVVTGPQNRTLDPDRDLNGASRRALTLAFILALTKVSGVRAPNLIDTPLGMTSGDVKESILRTAATHSTQLILFLTRSEIRDVEHLIDAFAGKVWTLSNSAHFPTMLVHDPGSVLQGLVCSCNHRQLCDICERHRDASSDLTRRSA